MLCRTDSGDKNPRFEAVQSGLLPSILPPLTVVAFVGDNITDFPKLSQAIRGSGDDAFNEFGSRYLRDPEPDVRLLAVIVGARSPQDRARAAPWACGLLCATLGASRRPHAGGMSWRGGLPRYARSFLNAARLASRSLIGGCPVAFSYSMM